MIDPKADYVDYLDKLIRVNTKSGPEIRGELIEIGETYLTLEHRDRRHTKIRYRDINIISEIGAV